MDQVPEKQVEQWRCKGRAGSGCGWTYRSPIAVLEVLHRCKDGEWRTLSREGLKPALPGGR